MVQVPHFQSRPTPRKNVLAIICSSSGHNGADNAAERQVSHFFMFWSTESQSMLPQDVNEYRENCHAVVKRPRSRLRVEGRVFCRTSLSQGAHFNSLLQRCKDQTHRDSIGGMFIRIPNSTGFPLLFAFLFSASPIVALSAVSHQSS